MECEVDKGANVSIQEFIQENIVARENVLGMLASEARERQVTRGRRIRENENKKRENQQDRKRTKSALVAKVSYKC